MRSSVEITTAEQTAYAEFCKQNDVIVDGSPEGTSNAELVGRYFRETWGRDITPENLSLAYEQQLKPLLHHIKYEPYQKELGVLFSSLSPEEQRAFADWKGVTGLKGTAKAAFVLIDYVKKHGWQVDAQHLDLAVGQRNVAPFLEFAHVSTFKSKHNIVNDGKPTAFFTKDEVNKDAATYKAEAESAAAKNRGENTSAQSKEVNQARIDAEGLQGRTHYETEQILKPLVADAKGNVDWQSTLRLRKIVQAGFDKARMVRTVQR